MMTKQSKILIGAGVAVVGTALYFKQQQMNAIDADATSLGVPADDSGSDTELWFLVGAVLLGLLLMAYITREVLG